jgi:hypothetical protein
MACPLSALALLRGRCLGLLLGSASGACLWASHLMDHLLCQAIADSNFRSVTVYALDRSALEVQAMVNKQSHLGEEKQKLRILTEIDLGQPLQPTQPEPETTCIDNSKTSNSDAIPSSSPAADAIFIYSLSELVLTHGTQRSLQWIRRINQTPSLFLFASLQQSLHTIAKVSQISQAFPVVIKVVANMGMLGEAVAGEAQVLRRSRDTGKVSEHTFILHWQHGVLQPLSIQKPSTQTPSSESSTTSSTAYVEAEARSMPRLITFDSTDPEFDEDSDPDADLDL